MPKRNEWAYPRLKAEIYMRNLYYRDAAQMIGVTVGTFQNKVFGRTCFTIEECKKLKRALGTKLPLERLFETADEMKARLAGENGEKDGGGK